jgi:predicted ATP-grasp superfamily ATP-dependent carboligase
MTSTKNFIVIGAHRTLIIQVLLSLHAAVDADCVVICTDSTRYLQLSNMCSRHWIAELDGSGDDSIVDIVNRCADTMPGLLVIPSDCLATRLVNRVRGRLRAPIARAPDEEMLDLFDNKWRFHHFCERLGLNVPPTQVAASKEVLDFSAVERELGLPFIVKPLDQHGAAGLLLIASEADYREKILDNNAYRFAPLLVQRYVRGIDVGLNLLAIRGKVQAIAVQRRDYPQNEEAKIRFFVNDYLAKAAFLLCEESGYDGVMNIDARIEEHSDTVYLFEANPRYWVSLSASSWCGLNFLAENLARAGPSEDIRVLASGTADTFYHPLFRPALWPYVLFGRGGRGRMSRIMARDLCTLGKQVRTTLVHGFAKNLPPGVSLPDYRGWAS